MTALGVLGEVGRLFHRGVAAADDQHVLLAEEEAVAGGARRHAVAGEPLLRRQAEPLGLRAGGDDERLGGDAILLDARDVDGERPLRQIDLLDVTGEELGAEALRLLAELLHQVGPEDALREAGIVLDLGGVDELPAGRSALDEPLDDQRRQRGARGVDRRRQPRRPRSDDDDAVVHFLHGHDRKTSPFSRAAPA